METNLTVKVVTDEAYNWEKSPAVSTAKASLMQRFGAADEITETNGYQKQNSTLITVQTDDCIQTEPKGVKIEGNTSFDGVITTKIFPIDRPTEKSGHLEQNCTNVMTSSEDLVQIISSLNAEQVMVETNNCIYEKEDGTKLNAAGASTEENEQQEQSSTDVMTSGTDCTQTEICSRTNKLIIDDNDFISGKEKTIEENLTVNKEGMFLSNDCTSESMKMTKENQRTDSNIEYFTERPSKKHKRTANPLHLSVSGEDIYKPSSKVPYSLAIERNALRLKHQIETGEYIPGKTMSHEEWLKQKKSLTPEQVELDKRIKMLDALKIATEICAITVRIQVALEEEVLNEKKAIQLLEEFVPMPVSPLALIKVPHFVLLIKTLRRNICYSTQLQKAAERCYDKCHVMFPLPIGESFETMYAAEVQKLMPNVDGIEDILEDLLHGSLDGSDQDSASSD